MSMPDDELIAAARRADPDRTLCAMLLPAAPRRIALALLLLNQELARIPEVTGEPMAGLLRMRWWQDALLGDTAAGAPGFVGIVREAIAAGLVPASDIEALVEARAMALDTDAALRIDGLIEFAGRTAGHLQAMTAALLTAEPAWHRRAAAAGEVYGLVGLVRAIGHQAKHGRGGLPADMLRSTGLGDAAVRNPGEDGQLRRACEPLVAAAADRLAALRSGPRPPRALMPALLIGHVAQGQLSQVARHATSIVACAEVEATPWAPLSVLSRYFLRQI